MEGKETIREGQKEKLPDNVAVVERPEARYLIIYESHEGPPHSPEVLGNADGFVVGEYFQGGSYENPERAEGMVEGYLAFQSLRVHGEQDSRLERRIKEKKMPIFLAELTDPQGDLWNKLKTAEKVKLLENLAGGGVAAKSIIDAFRAEKEGTSRRDFIKNATKGALGLWLNLGLLEAGAAFFQGKEHPHEPSKLRQVERALGTLQEGTHPEVELLIRTLRNATLAVKLKTIALLLEQELRRRPEIAIIIGASHFGIEKLLEVPQDKLSEMIVVNLDLFGLDKVKEKISVITEVRYDEKAKQWRTKTAFNEPYLERAKMKK